MTEGGSIFGIVKAFFAKMALVSRDLRGHNKPRNTVKLSSGRETAMTSVALVKFGPLSSCSVSLSCGYHLPLLMYEFIEMISLQHDRWGNW